jgi:hypothetical protein
MLSVVMLGVAMLSVVTVNVVMLSVILLNVVAPSQHRGLTWPLRWCLDTQYNATHRNDTQHSNI